MGNVWNPASGTALGSTESILGSALGGSSGAANRTYTTASGFTLMIDITVNGTTLHEGSGKDFTTSGTTITFLNAVDDTDNIRLAYLA